jgi:hypothetical protein
VPGTTDLGSSVAKHRRWPRLPRCLPVVARIPACRPDWESTAVRSPRTGFPGAGEVTVAGNLGEPHRPIARGLRRPCKRHCDSSESSADTRTPVDSHQTGQRIAGGAMDPASWATDRSPIAQAPRRSPAGTDSRSSRPAPITAAVLPPAAASIAGVTIDRTCWVPVSNHWIATSLFGSSIRIDDHFVATRMK